METIYLEPDFESTIQNNKLVCFFVHSPWSGYSVYALSLFNNLALNYPEIKFVIIDNSSGQSFIYKWLETVDVPVQNGITLKKNWIHGNGEVLGFKNKNLIWFYSSILSQQEYEKFKILIGKKILDTIP